MQDSPDKGHFKLCPCGKTGKSDLERISRTWLMRNLLFWLPLKRYRCYRCMRNRWVLRRG